MFNHAVALTAEQVGIGHPDKICDQISDALVDEYLKQDPNSRLAIEAAIKNNTVMVFGEVTSLGEVDVDDVVRDILGSMDNDYLDGSELINRLAKQSPEIANGTNDDVGGAGDQGIMVGYAENNSQKGYLPKPYFLASKLIEEAVNSKIIGKDTKAQVSLNEDGTVNTVVFSGQHPEYVSLAEVRDIAGELITHVLGQYGEQPERMLINPAGKFTIGGSWGDAGLTGRKVIADTYGSIGRHGGGAFSGKDPSKVDRSAAYFARAVAKNIVRGYNVDWAEVRVAYAIGIPEPVELSVNVPGSVLQRVSSEQFVNSLDWTPKGITDILGLREFNNYKSTSVLGHFNGAYPWESLDLLKG